MSAPAPATTTMTHIFDVPAMAHQASPDSHNGPAVALEPQNDDSNGNSKPTISTDEKLRRSSGSGNTSDSSSTSKRSSSAFFSRQHCLGPVTKDYGDVPLLVCCFVTGLLDAAVFSNWGVFVGMQTGNTVILGLSTAGLPNNPHAWLTTLVSIVSFLVGAFLTFRTVMRLAPAGIYSNRLLLSSVFLAQALFVILAAGLATPTELIPQAPGGTSRNTPEPEWILHDWKIVALIPPLALSSGMQIATSRLLGYNELPVNVLTSTYCDIMGDFKLTALNNVKRNRRVAAVVLLLVGAIISGWLLRSEGGLECVLWIGGGIKFLIAVALFVVLPSAQVQTDLLPK